MVFRRIAYAVLLLASVAVFIMTDNYIALFLGVLLLVLPPVAFVMLLFARRKIRFEFNVRSSCIRGGSLKITTKAGLFPRFLAGFLTVTVEMENTTFNNILRKDFLFKDLSFSPHVYDYISENSGRICLRVKNLKIVDWLGIFSLKIKNAKFAEAIVSPILYDNLSVRLGVSTRSSVSGTNVLPIKGGDRAEIYNVRDYVSGDSVKDVHWKLSSKFDALKTKEYGSTDDRRTLILVDMSRIKYDKTATDEQLNGVLDAAVSISGALKAESTEHSVGWFDDGEFCRAQVYDGESFVQAVSALMSVKVNDKNAETLFYFLRSEQKFSFTKIIFITPFADKKEWKGMDNADITVITVGSEIDEIYGDGVKIISVPCDGVCAALSGSEL